VVGLDERCERRDALSGMELRVQGTLRMYSSNHVNRLRDGNTLLSSLYSTLFIIPLNCNSFLSTQLEHSHPFFSFIEHIERQTQK
jgi:hypothetical protein